MAPRDIVARRSSYEDNFDFIPTPPWATRALFKYVAPVLRNPGGATIHDPAAGAGHMMKVFEEYGHRAIGTDIMPRCAGVQQMDFKDWEGFSDYVVTNPPYGVLSDFIRNGLSASRHGLALLVRVQALEGQGRWNEFYRDTPPTRIGLFADRIPFKQNVVVRKAPKMFFHCWLWWHHGVRQPTEVVWVPPGTQKLLEKDEDYDGQ